MVKSDEVEERRCAQGHEKWLSKSLSVLRFPRGEVAPGQD